MDSKSTTRPAQRRALLAQRQSMSDNERAHADQQIRDVLKDYVARRLEGQRHRSVIACYWPIRGEPDLSSLWRDWMEAFDVALPVVTSEAQPLRFARWRAAEPLSPGAYGVPVPRDPCWVEPDLIVLPCLGFFVDTMAQVFRLGYGGGYYDRTLAHYAGPAVGVAYAAARLTDFAPLEHDRVLEAIITQDTVYASGAEFGVRNRRPG
jgi:5,10-methenyltetrahydrofolate synthetase